MRDKPSPATDEENSYDYRLEWDDKIVYENLPEPPYIESTHEGPGSRFIGRDYVYAFELYEQFRDATDSAMFTSVRLIRIDDEGNETVCQS